MEERKTIFDYIGQVFGIFGFSIITLNIFCLIFGEEASGFSRMFSLGKEGLSIATMLQFFSVAVWVVFLRFLFFTDVVIRDMRVFFRSLGMVSSVLMVIIVYILVFEWFPADMWLPWVMFFTCFGICFVVSVVVTSLKERMENKKMEEALIRLKTKEGNKNEVCD